MRGRRRRTAAAAAVALLALSAGCQSSPEQASDLSTGSPDRPPSTEASAGSTATDSAGDLAEEAEKIAGASTGATNGGTQPVLGGDISWPQCAKGLGIPQRRSQGLPMPLPEAEYVVIGLTNGPAFTTNPCLEDQLKWISDRSLLGSAYSVLSYPTSTQLTAYGADGPYPSTSKADKLRNVGHAQAQYNIANLRKVAFTTPIVWLDVEPVRDWEWSNDLAANSAVVEGAARAYEKAGYDIGVYSTPALWAEFVGDFELKVPEWRAAGETSQAEALIRCGDDWSIQGGQAVLGQWLESSRDLNITCPGTSADMERWFHQY